MSFSDIVNVIIAVIGVILTFVATFLTFMSFRLSANQEKSNRIDLFENFVSSCNAVLKYGSIDIKDKDKMEDKEDAVFMMLRRLDFMYSNKKIRKNIEYYIDFNSFYSIWRIIEISLINNHESDYFSRSISYMKKSDIDNLQRIVYTLKPRLQKNS